MAEEFDLGVENEGGMEEVVDYDTPMPDEPVVEDAADTGPGDDESVEEPVDTGEPLPQGDGDPGPSEPFFTFKTGDGRERVFNSADEVNQYFSTWNGRLSKQAEVLKDYQQENQKWAEWYEKNRDLVESANKAEKAVEEPDNPANLLTSADWNYVNQLYARGETTKAMQYLAYKTNEHVAQSLDKRVNEVREELRSEYNEVLGPMKEKAQVRDLTVDLLKSAQLSADEYGNPTFPEFQEGTDAFDAEFVSHFAQVFKDLPVQIALDPQGYGIMLAYDRTHRMRAQSAQHKQAVTSETRNAATERLRDANGRFIAQTEAQATAIGGSPGKPNDAPKNERDMTADEFKRAMSNAGKRDEFLGVEFE